ncbi:MAG: VWA domain-containing protein [Vicinamibacteria bacterium]|nr:VWA domain-containing protein [Vicinamibacteria bacterium]
MRLLPVACVALLAASASARASAPAQAPVFATRVETVLIDAFVTTETGGDLPGLTAGDFVLKDNGVVKPFELVPVESVPIRVILVFDTSNSMKGEKLERLRAAADSFLNQLRPQDEAGLVSFSDEVALKAPLTNDLSQVRSGLHSLKAQGATSVYDAIFTALITPRSALRTLLIVFSDGEDNMSWIREPQLRSAVERSNALIHVVTARGAEFQPSFQRPPLPDTPHMKALRDLARITGGSLIEVNAPDRIETAFVQIVRQMKSRYLLRYTPEVDPTPGWHVLELKLRSRKGRIRGRTGFWVESRP